jgi:hypothetical protein
MKRLVAALVFAALAVTPLSADLKYVSRLTARPSTVPLPPSTNPMFSMLGGVVVGTIVPTGGIRMTVTIGERGTRIEYDQAYLFVPTGGAMLIRPDGSGIVINPADKTYWRVAKLNAGFMGATLNPDVKITPTGESAVVAGVRANLSSMTVRVPLPLPSEGGLPGMPNELSISGDVWLAPQYARYAKMMPAMANGLAAIGMDTMNAEGFPMRVIVRGEMFAGQEIETVVTSISELSAPASAFDVPSGYKEVPQPAMPGIGIGR